MDNVPVPVRSGRDSPSARMRRIRFKYWYSSCWTRERSAAEEG